MLAVGHRESLRDLKSSASLSVQYFQVCFMLRVAFGDVFWAVGLISFLVLQLPLSG